MDLIDWSKPPPHNMQKPLSSVGAVAIFALDMLREVEAMRVQHYSTIDTPLEIRIGMHTGTVVGGIIGKSRPHFEIWGSETIFAQKLESSGIPGCIHVSEQTAMTLYYEGFVLHPHKRIAKQISESTASYTTFQFGKVDVDRIQASATSNFLPVLQAPGGMSCGSLESLMQCGAATSAVLAVKPSTLPVKEGKPSSMPMRSPDAVVPLAYVATSEEDGETMHILEQTYLIDSYRFTEVITTTSTSESNENLRLSSLESCIGRGECGAGAV